MFLQVAFLRQLVDVPGTNTSSWEVKGLTTGARYSFTVQSYNQQGRPYHTSPPVEVLMRGTSALTLLGASQSPILSEIYSLTDRISTSLLVH